MEDANGSVKGAPKPMNGISGLSTMNGHATTSRRKPTPKPRRGFFSSSLSILARLLAWYSILTVLFRCPATIDLCTDDSPRICKQYFRLKHAVSPHLEPYYDTYAAPYVELARPYYETADQKVLTPAWFYATKYGGPRIAQAQAFGQAQWETNLQPELAKYQSLAKAKYDQTLAQHVDKVSSAVAPYYGVAKTNALQTYHDVLLPSYLMFEPYVQQGYTTASTFTSETAVPSIVWAWNKTYVFLDGTVWPHLRFIYTENVEPQLLKIGQRLGRHNTSNTQKTTETLARYVTVLSPENLDIQDNPLIRMFSTAAKAGSTATTPTLSESLATSAPASSEAAATSSETSSSEVAPPTSEDIPAPTTSTAPKISAEKIHIEEITAPEASPDEGEVRRIARETVAEDLRAWQEKYAKAADEGATEIEERIHEISKRMIDRHAKTMGKSLVDELKTTIDSELSKLRNDIKNTVSQSKSGSASPQDTLEQVAAAVRRAGMGIKDKSQDVRLWAENYEGELQAVVLKAAENHFKILDSISDLALQKIGMKWAWMDGITYKDWAKYHLLRERFDEWEEELKSLVTAHPGLKAAQIEGQAIEGEAMELAQSAAKELASLKLVAGWKLTTLDDSDDFDPEATRRAAEDASRAAAADAEASKAEAAAETPANEDAPTDAESPADATSEPVATGTNKASASIAPDQAPEDASDVPDLASTVVLEETPVFVENTTQATEPAEPVEASSADVPVDEPAESVEADGVEEADQAAADEPDSSATTASVKSAFLGAAAQSVPSRQPILDDDSFEAASSIISAMQSDIPATISSAASSAYSAAMSGAAERYSQALSIVSVQVSGTPKPAHEQMLASVTSAYGEAVAGASSRLNAALSAAQHGIFATTTTSALPTMPTLVDWANVESIALQRLNEGRSWAAEQYESAKVAIGVATPTPTDVSGTVSSAASAAGESLSVATAVVGQNVEKMLQNAQHNYYAGLGVAQARYSEFLGAASSALSSMTATPTPTDLAGTVSSVASAASESAASAASVVGENASSVAAAGYDNIASAAGAAGTFAHESWDAALEQISAQIYGQPMPTPWYESWYSAVEEYAAVATDAVGDGAEDVTSAAGTYAAVATEEASKQYVAVSSIVSELLIGKEPTFSESVYSRLAHAYAVASSSASGYVSAASETVGSVATEATEAVKEATQNVKDEL